MFKVHFSALLKTLGLALILMSSSPSHAQSLKSYDVTTNLTYGDILKELVPQAYSALDQGLKQKCYPKKLQGPYSAQFKARYGCGEIPYGSILNSKQKRVFQVKVPKGKTLVRLKSNLTEAKAGEPSVGAVTMRTAFEFNVLLDRTQYSTMLSTDLLDKKKAMPLQIKSALGETITVRHTPQAGALYSLVCGYLPGIKIQSQATDVNLDASYKWRWLFFSATERLSALNKVKNGTLSTTSGKVCGVVKTTVVRDAKGQTAPKVELLDVSYPTLQGLKIQGPGVISTKVVIHTLGLKIANFVLKLFKKDSIEKMVTGFIQETVKTEVNKAIKLHVNDIKTGKVFETIIKEALKKGPSQDILKSYSKAIKEAVDVDEISFKNDLVQQCKTLIKDFLKGYGLPINEAYINQTCAGFQVDVSLLPFAANTTYAQRGCYRHPHSPLPYTATGKDTWWMNSCGLSSRIRVTAPAQFIDAVKCLSTATTQKQQMDCVLTLLEDLFKIPKEILDYIDLIDSIEDLRKIAKDLGLTDAEIKAIEQNLKKLLNIK